jgi:hypothetical protein
MFKESGGGITVILLLHGTGKKRRKLIFKMLTRLFTLPILNIILRRSRVL